MSQYDPPRRKTWVPPERRAAPPQDTSGPEDPPPPRVLVLGGVPVERRLHPKRAPRYTPPADASQFPCGHCDEPLWIGPKQRRLLDAGRAVLFCPRCAVESGLITSTDQVKCVDEADIRGQVS